jgi:hypothetical protein
MGEVRIFYCHLINFTGIWYNLWSFGIHIFGKLVCFPALVSINKSNLATLPRISDVKLENTQNQKIPGTLAGRG